MKKIKEWWNTPVSGVMNKPEHIKYTAIVVGVVILLSLILILLFAMSNSLHTTTDTGTYTEKPVETTVSQNNQTIFLPFETVLSGGVFGETPILTLLFVAIPALIMGTFIRRRQRWIMFLFVQFICFVMFGVTLWTVLIPVVFLMSSLIATNWYC
jgi:hypothetical protein